MGAGEGNAACQVWSRTNTRYERVAPEGLHCDRPLPNPEPPLCFLSSQFHRPFLLPVCTEGRGQAALLFLPAVATKCFIKTGTVHCVRSAPPLASRALKAHAVCQPGYGLIVTIRGLLCGKKDSVYCCIQSREMQRIHLCFGPA